MKKIKLHYLFFSLFFIFLMVENSHFACAQFFNFSSGSSSGASCGGADCSNATCQLSTSGGKLEQTCPEGRRNDVDTACIMNRNAQSCSCMDTMPVSKINRVAETNCYRANGAGGNPKPRNHLGTDYAADAGTVVTAAADGNIVWAKPLGSGGRAIMIEHTKACKCSAKGSSSCDSKYVTVYLHLKDYIKTGGFVKKGDPIGHVGGSNYHTASNTLCDYPYPDGACKPYSPHLHFEIHSGDFSKGYQSLKSSIIDPLCGDIQSFCGGGSEDYSTDECLNKKNGEPRETLSEDAQKSKSVANVAGVADVPTGEGMSQTTDENCEWQQYMPDANTCYFCPLFKVLFNTASRLAQKTYQALAGGIAVVVVIFFALWTGLFVLKNIASLQAVKPGKMIQEWLVQAFRVLLVVLILRVSYAHVLRLTLAPVFNTGMAYAQTISSANSCSGPYMEGLMGYDKELTDKSQGALPVSMGENILCAIKTMQDGVWKIVAFGREVWCIGLYIKRIIGGLFLNPGYCLTGLLLMIGGLILVLAFPWCLIDCVLNMAIASALMPAAIGAWAFPKQASYLKKIWDYFMNAMFQFVFLSIILYIILQATQDLLSGLDAYATDYDKIVSPLTGLAFWGVHLIKLMTICLLGWVFLEKGTELAGEFAKAPDLDIGRKTGGFFAQAAERVALGGKDEETGKRKGGILGAAKEVGSFGKAAAGYYIGTPIRNRRIARKMENVKKNGQAIKDKDGNIIGYQLDVGQGQGKGSGLLGRLRPHKTTRFAMLNKDGSFSYSEEQHSIKGQIKGAAQGLVNPGRLSNTSGAPQFHDIVQKDQLLAVRDVTDSSGNVVHRDFAFKTDADKYIVQRDGRLNMSLINNMTQTTSLSQEMVNEAIMHAVMKDRHIGLADSFQSRETIHQDGRTIITQKNNDGSQTVVTSEIQNGQMLIHMRTVDKNGNITQITDNGVQRRTTTKKEGQEAVSHYSFNEHILNRSSVKNLMNFGGQLGRFAPSIDQNSAMWGFTEEDRIAFAKQENERKNQRNKHEKTTLEEFLNFAIPDAEERQKEEEERNKAEEALEEARRRWEGTDNKSDS